MIELAGIFNAAVERLFDLLLAPFAALPPIWGLLFVSALSGVLLLLLYGKISNQEGLRRVKRRIAALMLEAVLYRHDPAVSLKAQAGMFGQAFRYFGQALPPIALLMLPCLVLLAQLHIRYSYRPAHPGERLRVAARIRSGTPLPDIALRLPPGVIPAAPQLRVPETGEIIWLVKPTAPGGGLIEIQPAGSAEIFTHPLAFGSYSRKLIDGRYGRWWQILLFPGGRPLTAGPLSELVVSYPEERYWFFGRRVHWLVIFAVVSIAAGLAASKILKIEV